MLEIHSNKLGFYLTYKVAGKKISSFGITAAHCFADFCMKLVRAGLTKPAIRDIKDHVKRMLGLD